MNERVILVDERDRPAGDADKLEAHRQGRLHRAFSVFVVDSANRLLLQRRAVRKYHSGRQWSNTCCGHPRPDEDTRAAAERRLAEEMGFQCDLEWSGAFLYRARLGDLVEHEYDHVFRGRFDGDPRPDPSEVEAWRWIPLEQLEADLKARPQVYTVWLPEAFRQLRG